MSVGGSQQPTRKYAKPFEIQLRVARAKQLWSGRRASADKSFIPGAIDFALSLKTVDLEAEQNRELCSALQAAFLALDATLDRWDAALRKYETANQLEVKSAAFKKLRTEHVRVSFESSLARRLAKAIHRFDRLAVQGAAADRFARDLDLEPRPFFGSSADVAARKIKAILCLSPSRHSRAEMAQS